MTEETTAAAADAQETTDTPQPPAPKELKGKEPLPLSAERMRTAIEKLENVAHGAADTILELAETSDAPVVQVHVRFGRKTVELDSGHGLPVDAVINLLGELANGAQELADELKGKLAELSVELPEENEL